MTPAEELEVLAALAAVTSSSPAMLTRDALFSYSGDMEWTTPTGWVICVFNDCDEWDYISWILAPDAHLWIFPFVGDDAASRAQPCVAMTEALSDWQPAPENFAGWPGMPSL
jgi:hypothetical protein